MSRTIEERTKAQAQTIEPVKKPGNPTGNNQYTPEEERNPDNCKVSSYGNNASYLTARIARDYPETLEDMKNGKFRSVREANQIICGESSQVMATWPDECVDLVVTSPPYDGLRTYNGYEFPFEAIAQQLFRIIKQGGVLVWIVADQTIEGSETGTSASQQLHFMGLGFNLHDTMIYHKRAVGACGSPNSYNQAWEYMFVFSKGKPKTFNPLMKPAKKAGQRANYARHRSNGNGYISEMVTKVAPEASKRTNVWKYNIGFTQKGKAGKNHPASFPLQLATDHIMSWSDPGDLVLDPMCGSGTTLVAAAQLGRGYVGIDISQEYCDMAAQRIALETSQISLDLPIIEPKPRPGLHKHGGDRRSKGWNQGYNCNHEKRRGNSKEYLISRLQRDHPIYLDMLENGEFKSVRAAARAAGIIK